MDEQNKMIGKQKKRSWIDNLGETCKETIIDVCNDVNELINDLKIAPKAKKIAITGIIIGSLIGIHASMTVGHKIENNIQDKLTQSRIEKTVESPGFRMSAPFELDGSSARMSAPFELDGSSARMSAPFELDDSSALSPQEEYEQAMYEINTDDSLAFADGR